MPVTSTRSASAAPRPAASGARRRDGRGRRGPARAAAVPARGGAPRHDRAHVGRAARDGRRPDPRRAPRRRLLALPARPRWSVPDAGGHQRPRPLPDRPGPRAVRRGRHRSRRRGRAARWSSRTSRPTPRFLWVRGIDQRRFVASMLSVPLTWHDQTVGVLNVQTEEPRDVQRRRRRPARRGRRPARRHHREGPPADRGRGAGRGAQGDRRGAQRADRARHPRAAHAARGRPRLRRPAGRGAAAARPRVARHGAARDARRVAPRDARADRAAGPPRRLDPGVGAGRARGPGRRSRPVDLGALVDEVVTSLRPILEHHPVEVAAERPPARAGRSAAAPPDRRAPRRERGQVRAARDGHPDRLVARRGRRPARRLGRGAGHPRRVARADLRAVCPPRHPHRPRLRDRPVRRQAARRIDGRPPVVRAGPATRRPIRRRPAGRRRRLNR